MAVYRNRALVMQCNARLAAVSRALQSRLQGGVAGDVATQFRVALAPPSANVQQGDEAWIDNERFAVVMVEQLAHETQVILQHLQ